MKLEETEGDQDAGVFLSVPGCDSVCEFSYRAVAGGSLCQRSIKEPGSDSPCVSCQPDGKSAIMMESEPFREESRGYLYANIRIPV